jgi:hypothetical protein
LDGGFEKPSFPGDASARKALFVYNIDYLRFSETEIRRCLSQRQDLARKTVN